MRIIRFLAAAACALGLAPGLASAGKPYDVLDLEAVPSRLAEHSLVFSLTRAGERLVATGIRGHVLLSDDNGQSWRQAGSVPVRSSLLDASFATPEQGWVVGHEAVILHTTDGGETWVKQADGRELPKTGLAHYQELLAAHPDDARLQVLVDEMNLAVESGADRPFFRVFPRDGNTALAAGAYGFLFRTTDGGATWLPVMELLELDQYVHIFDGLRVGAATPGIDSPLADLVGVGEMGTVLVTDPASGHWRPVGFPYDGSMFTIVSAADGALVTGGLRGMAFRSTDGAQTWQEIAKPASGAIVASTRLADGRLVLATQDGGLLLSADNGANFTALPVENPSPLSDLIEGRPGELVLCGLAGLRLYSLPHAAP